VGRLLYPTEFVELFDLLGAEAVNVHGAAGDEVDEALHRLRGAVKAASAASDDALLPRLQFTRDVRAAARAGFGELVFARAFGPLLQQHVDDLRNHIPGALHGDRIANAQILAAADRATISANTANVVSIVQRHVGNGDAANE